MSLNSELPRVLYKYRDLSDEDNRRYVRETLLENKVWLSSPADFNDPFDCRVHMSFNGSEKAWKESMAGMQRKYSRQLKRRREGGRKSVRIFRDKKKRHKDPEVLKRALSDVQQAFNRWGVFCLSECNDDLLMWSYYAKGHTGLCLGFAHLDVKPLGPALLVKYSSEFPHVDFFADSDERKFEATIINQGFTSAVSVSGE